MRSLGIVVLTALLILGVGGAAVAQQTLSSPGTAADQARPAGDRAPGAAASPAPSAAPQADTPASGPSSSTTIEVNPQPRGDAAPGGEGMASPRTDTGTRILGLDPTAATLVAAAILVIVIVALVAMARGGGATVHSDLDRRL